MLIELLRDGENLWKGYGGDVRAAWLYDLSRLALPGIGISEEAGVSGSLRRLC